MELGDTDDGTFEGIYITSRGPLSSWGEWAMKIVLSVDYFLLLVTSIF
jgi:hypothetical protein